jgi:peptidoglycan hydrolase CwlO-like protein
MNAQELLGLQEAYLGLYGEVLEESLADMFSAANDDLFNKSQKHANDAQKRLRALNQSLEDTYGKVKPTRSSSMPRSSQERLKTIKDTLSNAEEMMRRQDSEQNESYDLIISHLLDEGYANTPEEAQVILDNMSEGWKTDILKKAVKTTGKAAKYVAKKGVEAAKPTVKKYAKKAGRFAIMTALGLPL